MKTTGNEPMLSQGKPSRQHLVINVLHYDNHTIVGVLNDTEYLFYYTLDDIYHYTSAELLVTQLVVLLRKTYGIEPIYKYQDRRLLNVANNMALYIGTHA